MLFEFDPSAIRAELKTEGDHLGGRDRDGHWKMGACGYKLEIRSRVS
jgi:hypothetical protein